MTQKSAILSNFEAEAWNHAYFLQKFEVNEKGKIEIVICSYDWKWHI